MDGGRTVGSTFHPGGKSKQTASRLVHLSLDFKCLTNTRKEGWVMRSIDHQAITSMFLAMFLSFDIGSVCLFEPSLAQSPCSRIDLMAE